MIPLSGTNLKIYGNNVIKWCNDYKHTRYFINRNTQQTWFNNQTTILNYNQFNVIKMDTSGSLAIKLPVSYNHLALATYLTFEDSSYGGKRYYCFVNRVEMLNKGTTILHIEIDMFQTFYYDVGWMPSYVEREHCPQYQSNGLPVVNTIDEGLNYGDMYDTVSVENYEPIKDVYFLVIVCKQVVHNGEQLVAGTVKPTQNGMVQPLTFYIHPMKWDGSPPTVTIDNESAQPDKAQFVLEHLYHSEDMINNIVSLYVTKMPAIGVNVKEDGTINFHGFQVSLVELGVTPEGEARAIPKSFYVHTLPMYSYDSYHNYNKPKYDGFRPVKESKLLMHPYALTIIDDFKGNRMEVKNEYIEDSNLQIQPQGSLGVSNKISFQVLKYNMTTEHRQAGLEFSLIDNSANDVPIITDMLSAYLQGNRNSLENQKNSIAFNGAMGVIGSGLGVVSSIASKNIEGAVNGLASGVSGAGNSILQLQGMLAKSKDIDNIPPNLTKQGSNTYFEFGNGLRGVHIIKKQIKPEYQKMLEDFFNMYGYKVNIVKIPNLKTRQYWNFVKTIDATLQGGVNNEVRVKLQTIFNNGITLWHTDDIGNYNLENGVI